ncbi:MAG: YceK/YidQ family lipoprotein [Gammaproteobacteria bacterium]
MKSNVGRWAFVVFLSVFILGCSSIRARTDVPDDKEWTFYPGVKQDVNDMGRLIRGEPLKSGDDSSDAGWLKGMTAVILVFDLPFSAVFDTVVAPYDLYRIYNPQGSGDVSESSGSRSD